MPNNRTRGRRAEAEAAAILEAALGKRVHVISRPRQEDIAGGDIMVDLGCQVRPIVQCKRKAGKRPKWIEDALSEDGIGIARWDRSKWVLLIEVDETGQSRRQT
jgi:hypothetical protein